MNDACNADGFDQREGNMKKLARVMTAWGLVALIFFALTADIASAGMSDGSPGSPVLDQNEPQRIPSIDYFPLYPGTVWEYIANGSGIVTTQVLRKTALVEGAVTRVLKSTGGLKDFYTNDSQGIRLHREFQSNAYIPGLGYVDLEVTMIPPLRIAGSKVSVGQVFKSSGIARTNDLPRVGVMDLPYNSRFTVEALENITVPAGNFDTVRVSGNIWIQGQGQPITYNLAEGIGLVKAVSGAGTLELNSYVLGTHVNILLPNGGEVIPSGQPFTIVWEASQDIASFRVSYSMDNGVTWILLTLDRLAEKNLVWNVPTPKSSETSCLVKVAGYDAMGTKLWTDKSSDIFTIEVVDITSPAGGDTLTAGTPQAILWDTNGLADSVDNFKLLYTINGGVTWKVIHSPVPGEGNPGSYLWDTIPGVPEPKPESRIKLLLRNTAGKTMGRALSDFFVIQ